MLSRTLASTLRRWKQRPFLFVVTVLVLALGIGATITMSFLVNAVLFPRLPWPNADRLVRIHALRPDRRTDPAFTSTWNRAPISWQSWKDLERSPAFEAVAVWMPEQQVLEGDSPRLVNVYYASSSFLKVLGAAPVLGRNFTPEEDDVDIRAAIISHELWQGRFGGRPDVIGQTFGLSYGFRSRPAQTRVIGVLPGGFSFEGETPDCVLPIGIMAYNGSFETNRFLRALALLAPGVSIERAAAAAEPLVRRLESLEVRTARLAPLAADRYTPGALPLWVILAGSVLLLVIACCNVAGLLLMDASARQSEMAVKAALGASPARIVVESCVEYAALAALGSAAGVLAARLLIPGMLAVAPSSIQELATASVDAGLVVWSIGLGIATGVFFGAAPVAAHLRVQPRAALVLESRETTRRGLGGHRLLVVAQIALAFLLLACAALFTETVLSLERERLGFDPSSLSIAAIKLLRAPAVAPPVPAGASRPADIAAMREASSRRMASEWIHTAGLLERLTALPGVVSAAGTSTAPWTDAVIRRITVRPSGAADKDAQAVQLHTVTADYFGTMRISTIVGRTFAVSDLGYHAERAVVISRTLALRSFEGSAVGRQLFDEGGFRYSVIGVVDDVKHRPDPTEDLAAMYVAEGRAGVVKHIILRTSGGPDAVLPVMKRAIEEYDPFIAVTATTTMNGLRARSLQEQRFRQIVSAGFGGAALVLAGLGLFGVTNRTIAARRRELGIRVVLGAKPGNVWWLVCRDVAGLLAGGMAIGLGSTFVAGRAIRGLLPGVEDASPLGLALAAATLIVGAGLAVAPAMVSATRQDPVQVLKTS